MDNGKNANAEFKPYVPADKVMPEFTATAIIIGIIMSIIFGAANAYIGLRWYDYICLYTGSSNIHGNHPWNNEEGFYPREQYGPNHRFCW